MQQYLRLVLVGAIIGIVAYIVYNNSNKNNSWNMWTDEDVNEYMLWNGGQVP